MRRPLLLGLPLLLVACADDPAGSEGGGADAGEGRDVGGDGDAAAAPDAAGEVDASGDPGGEEPGCGRCHGTADDPAPPPSLRRATEASDPGVGAHRRHRERSDRHGELRCKHCHVVPETVDAPGHRDGDNQAEVTFSGLASAGVEASWDGARCTVYCHGARMHDEARRSPAWTEQPAEACDGCHGMPPPAPHPDATDCGSCHMDVMDGFVLAPHHAHLPHLGGAGGPRMACTDCHVGTDYHGPMSDGAFLDETTLCAGCHGEEGPGADDWHTYTWPE